MIESEKATETRQFFYSVYRLFPNQSKLVCSLINQKINQKSRTNKKSLDENHSNSYLRNSNVHTEL